MKNLSMKKTLTGTDGFTLIELMVVVAIIGVLTMLAVPQYAKYQARAHQAEAKTMLSTAFTAETSFSVENNSFTICANDIGIATPTGASVYYVVGFKDNTDSVNCSASGAATCKAVSWNVSAGTNTPCTGGQVTAANVHGSMAGATTAAQTDLPASTVGSSVKQTKFVIGAAGHISSSTLTKDTWTIDESKTLANTTAAL